MPTTAPTRDIQEDFDVTVVTLHHVDLGSAPAADGAIAAIGRYSIVWDKPK
jgi:hypothetical protein